MSGGAAISDHPDLSDVTLVGVTGMLDRSGGAERAFRAIVGGFERDLGMRVMLAAHLTPKDPEMLARATVLRPAGSRAGPRMVAILRQLIASAPQPAILFGFQLNSNIICSIANASLPRRLRLPIVLNDRAAVTVLTLAPEGSSPAIRLRYAAVRAAARAAYRHADAVVCNAQANAVLMRSFIGRRAGTPPIATVYNPLDAGSIQARFPARDRRRFSSAAGPLIVGHGRLHPQKGWDTLIRAVALIRPAWPGIRLRIVGEGDERPPMQQLAESLGLGDAFELPGFSPDPLAAVEPGDVYVLPSRYEGLPNSLLEALALGLPSIAADCPTGPAEILSPPGESGLLFPVDDVAALVEQLGRLLSDGGLRARLAEGSRRRAREFSLRANLDAYAQIFRRVLGRPVLP